MRKVFGPTLADVLVAVALTGLTLSTLVEQGDGRIEWLAVVLAVLSAAPLALRQRAPVATLWIIIGALVAYAVLGFGEWPNSGVAMVVSLFTVATLRSRTTAAVMFLATIGVSAVAYFTFPQPLFWSQIVQYVLIMAGAWAIGDSTRRWALRTEQLAKSSAEAVTEERVRIAREMHDIVSHHMSVISLQAGLAEYVLDTDPSTAKTAIITVGDASREALSEMRRLLDVLHLDHDDDASADYHPQPGLADLTDLITRIRTAGLMVSLSVSGSVRQLPAGPDLCAYRVVQESLTNVLKHAGPARAQVKIDYGELTLTVTITDDGRTSGQPPSPASLGIRGMRERAELYGGVLSAGPGSHGGFQVLLRLPLGDAETAVEGNE